MTIVKVATANPVKVEAIQTAFRHCFDEVKIISEEVNSGVPEQPTNELIFQGAENRINSIKKDNYDYLVSCEGGLIHQVGRWFNMQVVMIENREGKTCMGTSQGYEIPEKYVEKAIETSVAEVFDEIFEGRGGIRELTRGYFTRGDLIKDATIMALSGFLNPKWAE